MGSSVPARVGDITYIPTREGWLYLATVIDLQTRQILGYSLCEGMPDDLVKQSADGFSAPRPSPASPA